jgi:hypothetical protein
MAPLRQIRNQPHRFAMLASAMLLVALVSLIGSARDPLARHRARKSGGS